MHRHWIRATLLYRLPRAAAACCAVQASAVDTSRTSAKPPQTWEAAINDHIQHIVIGLQLMLTGQRSKACQLKRHTKARHKIRRWVTSFSSIFSTRAVRVTKVMGALLSSPSLKKPSLMEKENTPMITVAEIHQLLLFLSFTEVCRLWPGQDPLINQNIHIYPGTWRPRGGLKPRGPEERRDAEAAATSSPLRFPPSHPSVDFLLLLIWHAWCWCHRRAAQLERHVVKIRMSLR